MSGMDTSLSGTVTSLSGTVTVLSGTDTGLSNLYTMLDNLEFMSCRWQNHHNFLPNDANLNSSEFRLFVTCAT